MRGNSLKVGTRPIWNSGPALRRLLLLGLLPTALLLPGCATSPDVSEPLTAVDSQPSIAQQFDDAAQALASGEFGNAAMQLQLLQSAGLSPSQWLQWHLLSADYALQRGDSDKAGVHLSFLRDHSISLDDDQQQQLGLLKARWHESQGQFFEAARERDFISGTLSERYWQQNHDALWQSLLQLSELQLLSWAESFPDTRFGHWLQLAAISKNSQLTLDEHLQQVEQWRLQNPMHPAATTLPGSLALLADLAANRPQQVTLLLPLSGPLAKSGSAVRDGFMAAYFESLQKGFQTPVVQVLDSQTVNTIDDAYQQALFNGSQLLVGPFNKLSVQALQQRQQLPLPTLALNYGERDQESVAAGLYQFGLAPEDEARQIAELAWQHGHRRALALVPQGSWGERIYQAFEDHWLALGGSIGERRFYPRMKDYNPEVRALLNVDDSQARFKTMRQLLRRPAEFEPRRRQDADWVFMVALPQQARQITPTLAFNFAGDLPVYATSHLYSGQPQPSKDRDLNGIHFCDIPWLLEASALHDNVENSLRNGQGAYARLYAMGVDAYRLVPRLRQLEAFPSSQLFASTGALSLDAQRRIHRQTSCSRFRAGRPERLASVQ
ncbi:hypothetical protein CHH28_17905 [Bacterioplanes sanyensis]|uniref:Penicillin-binding protein activator n=1 Tax=Bacterioplanes sanyensis TaxID=1249553 RepID=A0A222FPJ1_9GAMM|nr:penicillin-binding protein activator [Bacterioplanes sanyensis]ASP40434.1 hypothetical protein CHH28_17905 [Bacterioplanes sanyensis]